MPRLTLYQSVVFAALILIAGILVIDRMIDTEAQRVKAEAEAITATLKPVGHN